MSSTPRSSHPTPHHRDRERDRNHNTPRNRDRDRERQRERNQPPSLPDYEPAIAPLTTTGHNAVVALLKSQTLRHLKTHLQHAGVKLTDSAGEVNERLTDARVRYQKEKERNSKRREMQGESQGQGQDGEEEGEREGGEGEGEEEALEEMNRMTSLEDRVGGITKRLEEQVRKMVDSEARVDGLMEVLGRFEKEAEEASVARSGRRQTRGGGRGRRRRRGEDEDGEEEDDDEEYEVTPEREDDDAAAAPPSQRLEDGLKENYAQWDRLSLTQRYSANNTYVGFYRIVHEAQHPGNDIPPVPHASTWFSHLEDPNAASSPSPSSSTNTHRATTRQQHQRQNRSPSAESDDVAIERESLATKCPLTLLHFRDPVTSTKCPHSFERDAIESMIAQSPTTVPAPPPPPGTATSRAARRIRAVKCPVCSVVLTGQDLRSDPVLLRRVRRVLASEREREDDDYDESGGEVTSSGRKRLRRSGITVADDDDDDDDEGDEEKEDEEDDDEERNERRRIKRQATEEQVRIKQERAVSSSAPMVVD